LTGIRDRESGQGLQSFVAIVDPYVVVDQYLDGRNGLFDRPSLLV
jgi:hypothetical protein